MATCNMEKSHQQCGEKEAKLKRSAYSMSPYIQSSKQVIVVTPLGKGGERTWESTIKGRKCS